MGVSTLPAARRIVAARAFVSAEIAFAPVNARSGRAAAMHSAACVPAGLSNRGNAA